MTKVYCTKKVKFYVTKGFVEEDDEEE